MSSVGMSTNRLVHRRWSTVQWCPVGQLLNSSHHHRWASRCFSTHSTHCDYESHSPGIWHCTVLNLKWLMREIGIGMPTLDQELVIQTGTHCSLEHSRLITGFVAPLHWPLASTVPLWSIQSTLRLWRPLFVCVHWSHLEKKKVRICNLKIVNLHQTIHQFSSVDTVDIHIVQSC